MFSYEVTRRVLVPVLLAQFLAFASSIRCEVPNGLRQWLENDGVSIGYFSHCSERWPRFTYNQPITFFVYDSKIMAKAVLKVRSFSDHRPCNFSDNLSSITSFFFTAQIINFEIYWVQDTGTEFCHEKTQYNDAKTKGDKSITKRKRLYSTWNVGFPKGAVFPHFVFHAVYLYP